MTGVLWVRLNRAEEIIYLCVLEILCHVLSVQEAGSSLGKQWSRVSVDHVWHKLHLFSGMITLPVVEHVWFY